MNKLIEELKDPIKELNKIASIELKNIRKEIELLIKNNICDEKYIENMFDRLLNLTYLYGDDIEKIYNDLLFYYKNINLKASSDYKKYYLEITRDF